MSKLILVIDDSPTVRKIVEMNLGRLGYSVLSFPDGIEALRWLSGPDASSPSCILLDITLPKMSGYEIAQYLKAKSRFHHTHIIMLTRCNGIKERLYARLAGATGYLLKPFTITQLARAIDPDSPDPSASQLDQKEQAAPFRLQLPINLSHEPSEDISSVEGVGARSAKLRRYHLLALTSEEKISSARTIGSECM